jgi:hypothetical protein
MAQIVSIAPAPQGQLSVFVGKKIIATVMTVAKAKEILRKRYGSRFDEYKMASGFLGKSIHGEIQAKVPRTRNIAMGSTAGTGPGRVFHPFRSSPDYDPTRLSGSEGTRARGLEKQVQKQVQKKQSEEKSLFQRKKEEPKKDIHGFVELKSNHRGHISSRHFRASTKSSELNHGRS